MLVLKEIAPHITVDDQVCHGRPVVKGTRVPVEIVLGQLASGLSAEEVARGYDLTRKDVLACLSWATELAGGDLMRAV